MAYSIEDNNINSVTTALSTQSFAPGSTVTPVPTTPSGFTLTPGNYTGVVTINTPSYANGSVPEYYLLTVTVVVATTVTTELRINDIELAYTDNFGGGGGAVSSVSGVSGRTLVSPTTGAVVVDLPAVWTPNFTSVVGTWGSTGVSFVGGGTPATTLTLPTSGTLLLQDQTMVNNIGLSTTDVSMTGPQMSLTLGGDATLDPIGLIIRDTVNSRDMLSYETDTLEWFIRGNTYYLGDLLGGDPMRFALTSNSTNAINFMTVTATCNHSGSGTDCRGILCNLTTTGSSIFGNLNCIQGSISYDAPGNTTSSHTINGVWASTANFSSGTIATVSGGRFQLNHVGAGLITNIRGFNMALTVQASAGTVSNLFGFDLNTVTLNNKVTNATGVHVVTVSGATGNNYAIWLDSNTAGTGGGLVFGTAGDTTMWRGAAGQLLTTGDWMTKHYLCSSTPTVAAGAGAGTGPTVSIAGSDHGFVVNLTTGTTATTNATLFTVTFGAAWTSTAPSVTWSGGNTASEAMAVAARPIITAVSTTTMTFTSGATALADSTAYIFRFTAMR